MRNYFFEPLNSELSIFSFQFSIFNSIWAFRLRLQLRRRAFRYIFAHSAIASFAKDAAPIPNAKALYKLKILLKVARPCDSTCECTPKKIRADTRDPRSYNMNL